MSEQVPAWTKRVEVPNAQSAIISSLSDTKHFDNIKTVRGDRDKLRGNNKQMPKHQQSRVAITVVPAIHPDDAWPRVRMVQSVAKSIT